MTEKDLLNIDLGVAIRQYGEILDLLDKNRDLMPSKIYIY